MEGKAAKIGLVIMIAMILARFIMTDEQKSDLSALFERGDSEDIASRIFNGVLESEVLFAGLPFNVDYSGIRKRFQSNPVNLNQVNSGNDIAITNEPIPLDYSSTNGFEMFTYLNSEEAEEFETEPLESSSTINATMDLFFPRR